MSFYLLSFYTEGSDIDGCYDLRNCAEEIRARLSNYFTDIFLFNKRTLKQLHGSHDFCNYYEEALQMNPNANFLGYFDFKGFLIKETLNKIPEDSILIYHDANFNKNIQYWQTDWENLYNICIRMLSDNKSDVFCQFEREGVTLREYVKTYTLDKIFTDAIENEIVKNCILINAARIIVRNTPFARKFIQDYIDLCLQKDLLAKSPNLNSDERFQWSCGDQDVLNCLIYKYILEGKFHARFPIYSFLYRVMRYENRPFTWFDKPHPTGISIIENKELINYIKNKQ